MATGPLSERDLAALRAERDALEARAIEAETIAEQLADELIAARAELARRDRFELDELAEERGRSADHDRSDAAVLPVALLATAVVVALVAALSVLNNGILSLFTLGTTALAGVLGRFAWRTRVIDVDIRVESGVAHIRHGRTTYTFDLTDRHTVVTLDGTPGSRSWALRFERRVLDSVEIDGRLIKDPERLLAALREYLPDL